MEQFSMNACFILFFWSADECMLNMLIYCVSLSRYVGFLSFPFLFCWKVYFICQSTFNPFLLLLPWVLDLHLDTSQNPNHHLPRIYVIYSICCLAGGFLIYFLIKLPDINFVPHFYSVPLYLNSSSVAGYEFSCVCMDYFFSFRVVFLDYFFPSKKMSSSFSCSRSSRNVCLQRLLTWCVGFSSTPLICDARL